MSSAFYSVTAKNPDGTTREITITVASSISYETLHKRISEQLPFLMSTLGIEYSGKIQPREMVAMRENANQRKRA